MQHFFMRSMKTDQIMQMHKLIWVSIGHKSEDVFSHPWLSQIGFLPMWETSISHDHCSWPFNMLVLGTIHLKVGEKESIMSQSMLILGVGISTRVLASLVTGWNSYPSGEISLSCMDTHGGFLYSLTVAHCIYVFQCMIKKHYLVIR